jgi:hypothetical protein
MTYHYTKLRWLACDGWLLVATKPEAKHRFHAVAAYFHVTLTKYAQSWYTCYLIQFHDSILYYVALVSLSLQISCVLQVDIINCSKSKSTEFWVNSVCGSLNGIFYTPTSMKIRPPLLYINDNTDGQTRPVLYAFISCTPCKKRIIMPSIWI